MQCVTHQDQEAVDVCLSCGKAICVVCATRPDGSRSCQRCLPPEVTAPASAEAPAARPRSPLMAGMLAVVPGLGQIYNGEVLKGISFLVGFVLLAWATTRSLRLSPFIPVFWCYQMLEAAHGAARGANSGMTVADSPLRPESRLVAISLIAAGALLLIETTTGTLLRHASVLIPTLVISAGIYLLMSYFRSSESTSS